MDADHIVIGGDAGQPEPSTSKTYKDMYRTAKQQNTGLSPFAADNIRKAHLSIGDGKLVGHTEANSSFLQSSEDGRTTLPADRIDFFKSSHIKIGSHNSALDIFRDSTN